MPQNAAGAERGGLDWAFSTGPQSDSGNGFAAGLGGFDATFGAGGTGMIRRRFKMTLRTLEVTTGLSIL
jgi:hypothetical protein